jgi:hypothetical protein
MYDVTHALGRLLPPLAVAALIAGCGSSGGGQQFKGSDDDRIQASYQALGKAIAAKDGEKACSLMTAKTSAAIVSLLASFASDQKLTCERAVVALGALGSEKDLTGARLTDIHVDGDHATATAKDQDGDDEAFARAADGTWKLDSALQTDGDKTPTSTTTPDAAPAARPAVASVGETVDLAGSDGLKMGVTVTKVIDPLQGGSLDDPEAGQRFVGIVVAMRNTSQTGYADSPSNGATLVYGDDEQANATVVTGGECEGDFSSDAKIAAGDRRKGCIAFELPRTAKLKKFQMTLNSGFADQTGEWSLVGAGAPSPSPSASAPAKSPSPSSPDGGGDGSHACDQNISAATGTTCGFANSVFKAYADAIGGSRSPSSSIPVQATSPATGEPYSMTCDFDGEGVVCTGGNDARVTFPEWAAAVY